MRETKSKALRIIRMAVADILLIGVVLVVFAFFHHVLPSMQRAKTEVSANPQPTVEVVLPTPENDGANGDSASEETPIVEETPEPDNRTPWQIRFEEHFSDTVERTETSYKSPNVSIEINTITRGEGRRLVTYHVADIYVASIENFSTYTANNELKFFSTQDALEMDIASDALISISGDFYSYQQTGLLVRNGAVYANDYTFCDICVMHYDGSIEVYLSGSYDKDEIMARNPYQIWNFGPALLDAEGKAAQTFNTSATVAQPNPRSAIGYYEPGHYCFVVVDGRQEGYSEGMLLPDLALLFEELGCTSAYNLDGGGSALMMFNHERYSRQSNGGDRKLGDILLIRETEAAQ